MPSSTWLNNGFEFVCRQLAVGCPVDAVSLEYSARVVQSPMTTGRTRLRRTVRLHASFAAKARAVACCIATGISRTRVMSCEISGAELA